MRISMFAPANHFIKKLKCVLEKNNNYNLTHEKILSTKLCETKTVKVKWSNLWLME